MKDFKFKKGEYLRINPDLIMGKRYFMQNNNGEKRGRKYCIITGQHIQYKGCLAIVRCIIDGKYRLNIYSTTGLRRVSADWTDDMLQKINEE